MPFASSTAKVVIDDTTQTAENEKPLFVQPPQLGLQLVILRGVTYTTKNRADFVTRYIA